MASGEEEDDSISLPGGNSGKQPSASGMVPAPPPEKPSDSRAWSRAHQRVKPIWKLERRHAGILATSLRPGPLQISPQPVSFSCLSSLSSSGSTAVITGRKESSHLRAVPGLFNGTLLYLRSDNMHKPYQHSVNMHKPYQHSDNMHKPYQHSDNAHKPYQQLESSDLLSSPSEKRPLSVPQKRLPASLDENNATSTDFPMVPSTAPLPTNPYLSLEAAGKKPSMGSLAPALSGKIPSPQSSSKPVLNNNIFMRPNIIKVPVSQATGGLKPVSSPKIRRAFLHRLRVPGNCAPQTLDCKVSKSICTVRDDATVRITLPTPSSFNTPVAPSQYTQNNLGTRGESRTYSLGSNSNSQAPAKEPQLNEAVRRLPAKDFEKPQQGYQLGQSCFGNSDLQWGVLNRSRRWKPPLVGQQYSRKYAGSERKIFPGVSDITGSDSTVRCTKKNTTHLLASHANQPSPSPAYGSVLDPLIVGGSKAPIPPIPASPLQPIGVAQVATSLSSIHLGQPGKEEAEEARTLGLPALGLSTHCQPDQIEADDTEELVGDLEGSSSDDENENEEGDECSLSSVSSSESMAGISRGCMEIQTKDLSDPEKVAQPALTSSLFPNIPPTIYFGTQNEKVEKLPWQQRKLLCWKMSTMTPNIVKQTIERSHFTISKRDDDWLGCWGRHMNCSGFRTIREHQKFNHFPGSFQIGRKDHLWFNLSRMQTRFSKKEFSFFPQSFILPQDLKLLHKIWESSSCQKWIVKPPASARGTGIHKWSQLPKYRPLLVQKYLHKPYLISNRKFDLRIYVYVTSYDPLRIYLFSDGLVRFASCEYSSSVKSLGNKFVHLTNYSINKKNTTYQANADETACQGHKWALKALWKYLNEKGIKTRAIWKKIKDIVIKTIISSEAYVTNLLKTYVRRPYNCQELFGFDIILDEKLKPWVLEVNISPSLHSNSPLDASIKGQMVRDLLNLAGFVLPNTEDTNSSSCTSSNFPASMPTSSTDTCPVASEHVTAQKMKNAYYLAQKIPDLNFYSSVLDVLTPDDVRILVEMEDEFSHRGRFERIFPSRTSSLYLRFFEQPRYYNILTTQWELKYHANKAKGIDLLRNWCDKRFHVEFTTDSAPLWSQPTSIPNGQKSDGTLNTSRKVDADKLEKSTSLEDSEDTSKEPNVSI